MQADLKLKFPFKQSSTYTVEFTRKENAVSFALPFNLNLRVNGATKTTKEYGNSILYVFTFPNINDAKDFNLEVDVDYDEQVDVEILESEMNDFMRKYEEGEHMKDRKIVVDEDGFCEYKY